MRDAPSAACPSPGSPTPTTAPGRRTPARPPSGSPAPTPATVLELGAGTGKLTDELLELGHDVLATDPLDEMLQHLACAARVPRSDRDRRAASRCAARSVDVVVVRAGLPLVRRATGRCPRSPGCSGPEGTCRAGVERPRRAHPLGARLGKLIDTPDQENDPTDALVARASSASSRSTTFRFWQPLRQQELRDLVRSRSNIAIMVRQPSGSACFARSTPVRRVRAAVPTALLMPYVTHCYKAVVRPVVLEDTGPIASADGAGRAATGSRRRRRRLAASSTSGRTVR